MKSITPLFYVKDIDQSIEFYKTRLGFPLNSLETEKGQTVYADFKVGSTLLMLVPQDLAPEQEKGRLVKGEKGVGVELFIAKENLKGYYEKLKSSVPVIYPLETKPYGYMEFAVADPDGYRIGFSQSAKGPTSYED